MALALSLGSVVHTSASYTSLVAYAAEEKEVLASNKATLEAELTDKKIEDVKASGQWKDASQDERDAYQTAIDNAKADLNDPNKTLDSAQFGRHINAIADAIKGLGKSKDDDDETQATLDQRDRMARAHELVDEIDSVKDSPKYRNASSFEKTSYDDVANVLKAEMASENPNVTDKMLQDVIDAKLNLGNNLIQSDLNRQALLFNIESASSLVYDSKLWGSDASKLKSAIEKAKTAYEDPDKTEDQLIDENKELVKIIEDIVERKGVDVEKYYLSSSDLKIREYDDNILYARARGQLLGHITEVEGFTNTNEYNNISDQKAKNNLVNRLNEAKTVFNNTDSTLENISASITNLTSMYNEIRSSINAEDTEIERLKAKLSVLVNDEYNSFKQTNDYKASSQIARATYDKAISEAVNLLKGSNLNRNQLETAIRNATVTRLSVAPIQTKTLDKPGNTNPGNNNNQPTTPTSDIERAKTNLKNQIETAKNFKNSDSYKKGHKKLQESFNSALKAAEAQKNGTDLVRVSEAFNNLVKAQAAFAGYNQNLADLEALVNADEDFKKSEAYQKAGDDLKKAYNTSLETAKAAQVDKSPSLVKTGLDGLKDAKAKIQPGEALPAPSTDKVAAKDALQKHVENSKYFTLTKSYTSAETDKKSAFDQALSKANDLLIKYANDNNAVSVDDLNKAAKAIEDAKKAISTNDFNFPVVLSELIAEAPTVRASGKFTKKANENGTYNKQLTNNYNQLITLAEDYIKNGVVNKQYENDLVERINHVKLAIADEIGGKKLADLGLQALVDESSSFINTKAFTDAESSSNATVKQAAKDYKSLIENAKDLLNNANRSASDVNNLVNRINSAKVIITDPEIDKNVLIYRLSELIRDAQTVMAHPTYQQAPQAKRDRLVEASEEASKITVNDASDKIKAAISDLEGALNVDKFQQILNQPGESKNLIDLPIKELIEIARKVTLDDAFDDVSRTQKDNLREAVDKLQSAIESNDQDRISEAKQRLVYTLQQSDVRPITERVLSDQSKPSSTIKAKAARLLEDLNKMVAREDFKALKEDERKAIEIGKEKLQKAIDSSNESDIKDALDELEILLSVDVYKPIIDAINAEKDVDQDTLRALNSLISTADRVTGHDDFKALDPTTKGNFEKALQAAKEAVKNKNNAEIKKAKDDLEKALKEEKIAAILAKISKTAKEQIEDYISGDEAFRKTAQYTKAQKVHRDAYNKAIEEAKELLKDASTTDEKFEEARAKIDAAIKALDGNDFESRLKALKEEFARTGSGIQDASKKADIEKKIKALEESKDATMDELIAVETELKNAPRLTGSVTPVKPVNVQRPSPSTTVTPVTTTSQVPATVNPGSIVRTGVESLMKIVVVLALALGAYYFISKKGKDEKKGTNVRGRKENKTRTFEGDRDEN